MADTDGAGIMTTEAQGPSGAVKLAELIIFIGIFFPVFLAEKLTGRRLGKRWAGPVYALFAAAAFAGFYDLAFGFPSAWLYDQSIRFSDRSLIASMAVLSIVKVAQIVTVFLPPLSALAEEIAGMITKGVVALALQGALLRLAQAGFLLKYLLAAGFSLCAFRATEHLGLKLIFMTLIVFFTLPAVVTTESYLLGIFSERIRDDLQEKQEKIGSIPEIASDSLLSNVYSVRKYWNRLTGDTQEAQRLENLIAEIPSVGERLQALAKSIFDGLLLLLLLTVGTCIVAPLAAYWLLIRFSFNLLGRIDGISLRSRDTPAGSAVATPT